MSRVDYDLSQIRGVAFDMDGVLSGSTVSVREDGTLQRTSNVKDGYAIQYALKRGLYIAVISGARDESMLPAYRSLGISDIYFKCSVKTAVLRDWMSMHGLSENEVAFVGDDIPDMDAMAMVGLPVCPRDASVEVKCMARYISPFDGGSGVARDILSQILASKGEWMLEDAPEW